MEHGRIPICLYWRKIWKDTLLDEGVTLLRHLIIPTTHYSDSVEIEVREFN
jgi:hypothetical protein